MLAITGSMLFGSNAQAQNPKHEFRGAWMHTVGQMQYSRMTTEQNQAYLRNQLDSLQLAGINAIVWQVRPKADAFYKSNFEPWSVYLTGTHGKEPVPYWDPLQFMIDECHSRGMELHAWLNPYRVTNSKNELQKLSPDHIYHKHPEWFLVYANQTYFDPGIPECRQFICDVVRDIVSRYDVDAIHMDDYFYPYPTKDEFPDSTSYAKYGNGLDRGDWRRQNVDLLIEGLHEVLLQEKPWVRFGISPFGVWRNKSVDPRGSETNALQCYDALYADVLKWTEKGWVDYMVPQLYWELDHKRAPGRVLNPWWNDHANGRHMYIGQSVETTMRTPDPDSNDPNELNHKIRISRALPNVQGNCWWPGYSITRNSHGVCDSLATRQQSTIALVPAYTWIDNIAPDEVSKLKVKNVNGVKSLQWQAPATTDPMQVAKAFVVYRFDAGADINLNDAKAIVAVTPHTHYAIPADTPRGKYVYVVTTLDRVNNESATGTTVKVKL